MTNVTEARKLNAEAGFSVGLPDQDPRVEVIIGREPGVLAYGKSAGHKTKAYDRLVLWDGSETTETWECTTCQKRFNFPHHALAHQSAHAPYPSGRGRSRKQAPVPTPEAQPANLDVETDDIVRALRHAADLIAAARDAVARAEAAELRAVQAEKRYTMLQKRLKSMVS